MGKNLFGVSLDEYVKQNPVKEPDRERRAAKQAAHSYREQLEEQQAVEDLKAGILQQLEAGNTPELILYSAIKAIGILTNDEAWAKQGQQALDYVYADLQQQSFYTDNAAAAAKRLETMQEEYNAKLRRQLSRSLSGYRRIERDLKDALQALDDLDGETETE